MFYQEEGTIERAVGNREISFWQGKKAEIVLILFLMTSEFAVFICLWLFLLPKSKKTRLIMLFFYYLIQL